MKFLEFTDVSGRRIAIPKHSVDGIEEITNGFGKKYIKNHKFLKDVTKCCIIYAGEYGTFYSSSTYDEIMSQLKN